jgi:hypothetical protein
MFAEAKREFEMVREFLPFNATVADLLAQIPADADLELAPPGVEEPSPQTVVAVEPPPELQATDATASPFETPSPAPGEQSAEEPSPFAQLQPTPGVETQATAETSESTEDAFAQLGAPAAPEGATQVESPASADDAFGGLEAFAQIQPTEPPPLAAGNEAPTEPESPFAALEGAETASPFGIEAPPGGPAQEPTPAEPSPFESLPSQTDSPFGETPSGTTEEESFEQYSARMRAEMTGTEGTLSFEEYVESNGSLEAAEAPPPSDEEPAALPPAPESTDIESLTEKLQNAKKITPIINLADRTPRPASEAETPAGTGFVTPTLAEIYAKQGWYDDAIKAYRTLIVTKPAEREKFEKRIKELEELKAQQGQQPS